jgi:flagella basal body P-ring formation protein FlgA
MRLLRTPLFLHLAFVVLAAASPLRAGTGELVPAGEAATSTPLTREQLMAAVAGELTAHFNLEGELQLELLRAWAPPAHVASKWVVSVVEYPALPSSSMLVRIRISADGKPVSNAADGTLVLRASLWRDAWACRLPLTIGATFDPAVLEPRRVDLFRERDALPAAVGDRSFVFARAVTAGRLLTWRDITRRPLVKKGEMVEVSAASGLLVVTMKGLAMENGAQGDTVTVRNPESQKNFAAIVVDENRVQVRF